ncbi:MAG: undecaprenyl-diphosphate phosphatase [Candidatus Omnitrophica bacterium]|nr:undecaprenyl-diphosphate phosphatase [Candidatus Omnitrophota bacterium]
MINYIILGIIQGFTEFFPVSSSGHLVIFQNLLGLSGEEVTITVVLHLGTVLSLLIFFFKDILRLFKDKKLVGYVLLVTVITGIIGVLGKSFFENLFKSTAYSSIGLIITGVILLLTKRFNSASRDKIMLTDGIVLGFAQSFSIIPGISRSGMTISSLLFRNIGWETAFRFSFVASIPAILGAALLKAKDINFTLHTEGINLCAGFVVSFLSGIVALWLLKKILFKAKFYYFGYYCIIAGILALLIFGF